MPVINGVKMACAPCIRGHRSTKCAHHDRVMIAVKKPGRPLSTCPHAPGIQCGCGGVQAAIPIQHHGCRPQMTDTIVHHEVPVKTEDESSNNVVQSPTRTAQRVKKAKSNGHARRQSIDSSALERMNPSSLNIMPSIVKLANISNISSTNSSPLSSNVSISPTQKSHVLTDRTTSPIQKENNANSTTASSCYSSRRPPAPPVHNASQVPASSNYNGTQSPSTETYLPDGSPQSSIPSGGGCCSSKAAAPGDLPRAPLASPQPLSMAAYSQQLPHINHANPVMYTPAPVSGAGYWPSLMPLQVAPPTNGYVYMNSIAPQYPPTYQVYAPSSAMGAYPVMTGLTAEQHAQINAILGRPMQCNCGDVCDCVGCIDHPFNLATRDYVASAINARDWTRSGPGDDDATSPEDVHSSEASSTMPSPAGDALIEQMLPQPQALQQQAVASEYLVFNYSYGCLGEPEHCPCGDDCACVGCTIHGGSSSSNGVASNGAGGGGGPPA
ncbi:DNA-binding transcription factor-like protein [Microdochium nivale]|nr:DNA-binding transcription factor-like protein [Microdochium nivale]